VFQNEFLSSKFSILKISFTYETTIPETPKTVKDNFDIFKECRGTERKNVKVQEKTPKIEL